MMDQRVGPEPKTRALRRSYGFAIEQTPVEGEAGLCAAVKRSGDVCGRVLPCQYHKPPPGPAVEQIGEATGEPRTGVAVPLGETGSLDAVPDSGSEDSTHAGERRGSSPAGADTPPPAA